MYLMHAYKLPEKKLGQLQALPQGEDSVQKKHPPRDQPPLYHWHLQAQESSFIGSATDMKAQ
jgi:hypothetical protein